ncbi:hypothetical protein [Caballeronia terrestris]
MCAGVCAGPCTELSGPSSAQA